MLLADLMASGQVTVSIEWIAVSSITSDRRVNTRPVDAVWVDKKVKEGFDPNLLGLPIVSRRSDGTHVFLDGQNRGELIRRVGWADQKIQCRVFSGLTLAQEASLFLGHNDNRQVKAHHKFMARITEGEPTAVAINRIVENEGWKVSDWPGSNGIKATRALEAVYAGGPKDDEPGEGLRLTLRVIAQAWGYKGEAADGRIIAGVGAVFNRFGEAIDKAVLVKKLSEFPAGASGVIGKARGLHQYQGGTVVSCVAETVVNIYNNRRRPPGQLPSWR